MATSLHPGCFLVCVECLGDETLPVGQCCFYLSEYREGPLLGTQYSQDDNARIRAFVDSHSHPDRCFADYDAYDQGPRFAWVQANVFHSMSRPGLSQWLNDSGRCFYPF